MRVRAVIAGGRFDLGREDVERAVASLLPEPVHDHFVVVAGRRFPPKQVVAAATGLDRADFTTHQARSVLRRLGFAAGRRSRQAPVATAAVPGRASWPHGGREADALLPHRGRWVAKKDLDVLVSAENLADVVAWLRRHGKRADAVFRAPSAAGELDVAGGDPSGR